jgi:hypothetical protein
MAGMSAPKHVTFTGPEVQQLTRVAGTLTHVAKDLRKGASTDDVARRLQEIAETLSYLVNRASTRGTLQ